MASKIIKQSFRKRLAEIKLKSGSPIWHKINPGNINVIFEDGEFEFNYTKIGKGTDAWVMPLSEEKALERYSNSFKK